MKRSLSKETFIRLARQGMNCKQIAKNMGWNPNTFGAKMKEVLGMYPSVYIATVMKYGQT